MRRLAPLFISAALVTFAGTAAAGTDKTTAATDRTGSPTVSENTNKKPLSYSDKSNTAKGTNAKMEDSATVAATGSTDTTAQAPAGESRKDLAEELNKEDKDKAAKKKVTTAKTKDKNKLKKDTVASTSANADGSMSANGSTMPEAKPSPASDNPPLTATQAEKANSLTGKSAGQ